MSFNISNSLSNWFDKLNWWYRSLILSIWLIACRCLGAWLFIVGCLVIIVGTLQSSSDTSTRGPSAYSVFNDNCRRLQGEGSDNIVNQYSRQWRNEDIQGRILFNNDNNNNDGRVLRRNNKQYPNQLCLCDSGLKYKKCCGMK